MVLVAETEGEEKGKVWRMEMGIQRDIRVRCWFMNVDLVSGVSRT